MSKQLEYHICNIKCIYFHRMVGQRKIGRSTSLLGWQSFLQSPRQRIHPSELVRQRFSQRHDPRWRVIWRSWKIPENCQHRENARQWPMEWTAILYFWRAVCEKAIRRQNRRFEVSIWWKYREDCLCDPANKMQRYVKAIDLVQYYIIHWKKM